MKNDIYVIVIVFHIALLGAILNSIIGINIPVLREVIGFLYLTFIPGFLLLIIFRVKNLNFTECIFYSVCLSISFIMFIGFLMNIFYPCFGIYKPISLLPLLITLTIAVILLLTVITFQERDNQIRIYFYSDKVNINLAQIFSLCLLPFLSIFGTYLLNYYNINILLLFLILTVSVIPFIVASNKLEPNLYSFALFVVALSLLFHYSLVSSYLNGYDIQVEKYVSSQTMQMSYWDQNNAYHIINSLMSITMLAPIYSLITSMDLAWVYKIIYPSIFAFIVLGIYTLYRTQTDQKISFLSTFFFMSIFTFYVGMPQLARQSIAELFFVSLLCLLLNDKISSMQNSLMSIIFMFSLIVSHYSLSYIFVFMVFVTWLIMSLLKKGEKNISSTFIILSFSFMLSWYIYTSDSVNLYSLIGFFKSVFSNLNEFLNPHYVQGVQIIQVKVSLMRQITKWLHIISQGFITIGLLLVLINKTSIQFNTKKKVVLIISYIICVAGITVPYVSNALNTMRLYQITLIMLSPLLVIGFIFLVAKIGNIVKLNKQNNMKYYILSFFLAIYFIFNSGAIYEITGEEPNYISFNNSIDAPRFTELEVTAVSWLNNVKTTNVIYADEYKQLLVLGFVGESRGFIEMGGKFCFDSNNTLVYDRVPENTYVFLGKTNTEGNITVNTFGQGNNNRYLQTSSLWNMLLDTNRIYDGGKSCIYFAD